MKKIIMVLPVWSEFPPYFRHNPNPPWILREAGQGAAEAGRELEAKLDAWVAETKSQRPAGTPEAAG